MKCNHDKINLPHLKWFDWAEDQVKAGNDQTQCPECKLWLFPCEMINKEDK